MSDLKNPSEIEFHDVANIEDVTPQFPKRIMIDGHEIALFNVEGEIFATDNICSHAYASLADGFVTGDVVECPLHEACFNIRTGKVLSAPATVDIRTYPVQIADGRISVGYAAPR